MEIEPKLTKILRYSELPEEIVFFVTDIYPYAGNRLFITGLMQHGQTFNIVATEPQKEIYFALRPIAAENIDKQVLEKA